MASEGMGWREKLIISLCLIWSAICSEASPLKPTTSLRVIEGLRQQQKRGGGGGGGGEVEDRTFFEEMLTDQTKANGGDDRAQKNKQASRSAKPTAQATADEGEQENAMQTDERENQHGAKMKRNTGQSFAVCQLGGDSNDCELECPSVREAGSEVSIVCGKKAPPYCKTLRYNGISNSIGLACISTKISEARYVSIVN